MSGTIPVVVSNYLSGAVPGAALVVHSETPTDFSDYYVVDDGALFAVGNDLYVTDSALNAAVSESGEIVKIVDGGTLISGDTLTNYVSLTAAISASKSNILLVGFSSSGVNYTPATRTIIGIKDSTIADCSGVKALSDNGTTKLYGLVVTNNGMADNGGALSVVGGTTWIGKSVFSGNSTTGSGSKNGGAVGTSSKGTLIITDSLFSENRSIAGAGAVYANGSLLVVSGSTFYGNRAANYGGALYGATTSVITGSTFVSNVSEATSNYYGGALNLRGGTIADDMVFYRNVANFNGGAVSINGGASVLRGVTFSENTAKYGGGVYVYAGIIDVSISDTLFAGNTAATNGGAVYNLGSLSISGSTFHGNTATTYGGAIYNAGGSLTITGTVEFQTEKDTIYVKSGAALTVLDAQLTLNASVSQEEANLVSMTNSTVVFGNTSAVAFNQTVTFGSGVTLKFAGDTSVGFASGQTAPAAVVIDKNYTVGTTVVATGLTGLTGYTRGGAARSFDYWGLKAGNTGLVEYVSYSSNTLGVTVTDTITVGDGTGAAKVADFDFALADDFTGSYLVAGGITLTSDALPNALSSVTNNAVITVDGASFIGAGENYARALTVSSYGGSGSVAVTDPTQYYAYTDATGIVVVKGTTAGLITFDSSDPKLLNVEGEYYFGQRYSTLSSALSNASVAVIQGQTVTARLGNLSNGKIVVLDNLYGEGIETSSNGSIIFSGNGSDRYINVYGGTFVGNHTTGNAGAIGMQGGGELNINPHTEVVAGQTVTKGTLFINNWAEGRAGAVDCTGRTNITGATFSGNRSDNSSSFYGGAVYISSVATITDCVFDGNYNTAGGAGVYVNAGTLTLRGSTFFTATDYIYNLNGTVNVSGRNVFNASLTGNQNCRVYVTDADFVFGNAAEIDIIGLTFNDALSTMTFGGDAAVNFTKSGKQNLSAVAITVDGSQFVGAPITVATGVSAIDENNWTITDKVDEHQALKVDSGNLVMYLKGDIDDNTCVEGSFTGGTYNLMTGGTITKAFFGTSNTSGDVLTVISGGTVDNAVVGGAKVLSGSSASLDTVTLEISGDANIKGGTANGGMLYTAGYAYGKNSTPTGTDTDVTLSVSSAVLNLSDGFAPVENLYAGAHARQGALTQVTSTAINVTGGTYGRVYGGGWGENYGRSEVSGSTISVTGGTLGYIYAGGGNAANGASAVTGNVTISVSGNAQVGIVFLAGKNQNCSITGNVTMTVSGTDKSITRISGWNANGDKNTAGVTTLNVETNLSLQYLDNVKVIRIAEGKTMDVAIHLWHESAAAMLIDFDLDEITGANWVSMSGDGMDVYQAAQYTIDGGEVCRWNSTSGKLIYEASGEESGYALEFFKEENVDKVRFFKA